MVYHENAIIKLRNIPVAYTPYFSHPDPTVKRKSGFLPPSTKNFTDWVEH
jgi:LPS-assembly protein